MGYQLKKMDLGNGHVEKETCCMNYKCRFCGVRASASNYVLGMCLQVYAPHEPGCHAYVEDSKRAGYVTDCTTCIFWSTESGCTTTDNRM